MSNQQLSPKQQRFVDEYLVDSNATQAAIRAGYSQKTARQVGSRLLTYVDVIEAIEAKKQRLAVKTEISAAKVLADLCSLQEQAAEAGQFAASIRAAELIGKHLGMFIERVNSTVNATVSAVDRRVSAIPEDERLAMLDRLHRSTRLISQDAHVPTHLPGCNGKCAPGCPVSHG